MADINPGGADLATGRINRVDPGDILVDSAGNPLFSGGFQRIDITSSQTILASQSGALFSNNGASFGEDTLTLPGSPAAGLIYHFLGCDENTELRIAPDVNDQIILPNYDFLGDGFYVSLNAGSSITLVSNPNGDWEATAWAGQILTEHGALYRVTENGLVSNKGWWYPSTTTPVGYNILEGITYSVPGTILAPTAGRPVGFQMTGSTWEVPNPAALNGTARTDLFPYARVKFSLPNDNAGTDQDYTVIGLGNVSTAANTLLTSARTNAGNDQISIAAISTQRIQFNVSPGGFPAQITSAGPDPTDPNDIYEVEFQVISTGSCCFRLWVNNVLNTSVQFTTPATFPASTQDLRWYGGRNNGIGGSINYYSIEVGYRV